MVASAPAGAPAYDVLAVATLLTDRPLGAIETHPDFPAFGVLRPGAAAVRQAAARAQLRLIRAALAAPVPPGATVTPAAGGR